MVVTLSLSLVLSRVSSFDKKTCLSLICKRFLFPILLPSSVFVLYFRYDLDMNVTSSQMLDLNRFEKRVFIPDDTMIRIGGRGSGVSLKEKLVMNKMTRVSLIPRCIDSHRRRFFLPKLSIYHEMGAIVDFRIFEASFTNPELSFFPLMYAKM